MTSKHLIMKNKIKVEEFNQIIDCIGKNQFVYIDESGIKPNIIRDKGWSPKGNEIFGCRKGKREKNINIIAALNKRNIMAPFLYEGSMNTDLFNIYLEEFLLPVLKPGQIIVMDNASFHKSIETELLIEQAECKIFTTIFSRIKSN